MHSEGVLASGCIKMHRIYWSPILNCRSAYGALTSPYISGRPLLNITLKGLQLRAPNAQRILQATTKKFAVADRH